MKVTPAGSKRTVGPIRLLLLAGAALVMAVIIARAYPFLVGYGAPAAFLTAVRTTMYACLLAILVLPIAALIRQLTR